MLIVNGVTCITVQNLNKSAKDLYSVWVKTIKNYAIIAPLSNFSLGKREGIPYVSNFVESQIKKNLNGAPSKP